MKYLRFASAWVFYGAAWGYSLLFDRWIDDHGIGWRVFQFGQWLFRCSTRLQGPTAFGPWSEEQ